MVDTPALGAGTRKGVEVRVLSPAPLDSPFASQKIHSWSMVLYSTSDHSYSRESSVLSDSEHSRGRVEEQDFTREYFMYQFLLILILAIAITTIYALVRGIGWVPTWQRDVDRFLKLADIKAGEKVYDLGCGDGRLVIAAAKKGAQGIGLEVSILPFIAAYLRNIFSGSRAKIKFRDFWLVDLKEADVVYFFLIPRIYEQLKNKLEKELKPGARVVAYVWPISGWTPKVVDETTGQPKMYLYIR